MASSRINLFITFVDGERDLLKIWGKTDATAASVLEKQLSQLSPQLSRLPPPDPGLLRPGVVCFAKYEDNRYYRVRILSEVSGNIVKVLSIDHGHKGFVEVSKIIDRDDLGLLKIPEQAQEFYLGRVAAPVGGWAKEFIYEMRKTICASNSTCQIIAQCGESKICQITLLPNNQDYAGLLIDKNWAREIAISFQQQLISSYNLRAMEVPKQSRVQMPNFTVPPPGSGPSYPPNLRPQSPEQHTILQRQSSNTASPMQLSQGGGLTRLDLGYLQSTAVEQPYNPMVQSNTLLTQYGGAVSPLVSPANFVNDPMVIQALAMQVKQQLQETTAASETEDPHTYSSQELRVGSTHNVYISYIDDGPWSFSVQLQTSEAEIDRLMDELRTTKLVPIGKPIVPGKACVGKSLEYDTLCRGVVVNLSHRGVKVFFVDFGNSEDLPTKDVFELPVKHFKTMLLSQKFALSGLDRVKPSEEIKTLFKETVLDQLLLLRVVASDENNLQNCELFLHQRNIKEILNEKVRQRRAITNFVAEDPPAPGCREGVVATWVETPTKFYVQLQSKSAELTALKDDLAQRAPTSKEVKPEQLRLGLPCLSLYADDQQWYRARITALSEESVTVFYVDYGNTDTVCHSSLRLIEGGLMGRMKTQALRCSLQGFEAAPASEEVANQLEAIILERELEMEVVSREKDHLVVRLLDGGVDVGASLLAPPQQPPQQPPQHQAPQPLMNMKLAPAPAEDDWIEPAPLESGARARPGRQDGPPDRFGEDRPRSFDKGGRLKPRSFEKNSRRNEPPAQCRVTNRRADNQTRENWRSDGRRNFEGRSDTGGGRKPFGEDATGGWKKPDSFAGGKKFGDGGGEGGFGRKRFEGDGDGSFGRKKFDGDGDGGFGRKKFDGDGDGGFGRKKFDGEGYGGKKRYEDRDRPGGERRSFDEGGKKAGGDDWDRSSNKSGASGGRREKRDGIPSRKPVPREDVVPRGSTFADQAVTPGSCQNVTVTYYVDPSNLYVQATAADADFKTMMNSMQSYYSNKYSLRDPVQEGDLIVAKFSDRVLYRAEVVTATPAKVRFVDYGNVADAEPRGLWPLAKEFLHLPRQALRCSLRGVRPLGEAWPALGGPLDGQFEAEGFECTFHGCGVEGELEISLRANGKDVAEAIVAAGLARSLSPAVDIRPVDPALVLGRVLRLQVPFIEGVCKFFVHINPSFVDAIQAQVAAAVPGLSPLDRSSVAVGTDCISTADAATWYRGQVVDLTESGAWVQFVDYGDCAEVTFDQIMTIPEEIRQHPRQATECCLEGDCAGVTDEEQDTFKEAHEGKPLLVSFRSADGDRMLVAVYDAEGNKMEPFRAIGGAPETVDPLAELPLATQACPVVVSHFESPSQVYLTLAADSATLQQLTERLAETYGAGGETLDPVTAGRLCAAKSPADDVWYRGRIVDAAEDVATVYYLDYGNSEDVTLDRVKALDPSFLSVHVLAKETTLGVEFDGDQLDAVNGRIAELTGEKELKAFVGVVDRRWVADLVADGARVAEVLVREGLVTGDALPELAVKEDACSQVAAKEDTCSQVQVAAKDDGPRVFVSHIDSPTRFWTHCSTVVDELDRLQEQLQAAAPGLADKQSVAEGELVAALFADDGQWYRGKVTSVSDALVHVHFVDYGNVSEMDTTVTPVKELTEELTAQPPFARCFSLQGEWADGAQARFEEIVSTLEDAVPVVVVSEGDPTVVDLAPGGESITELLRKEGLAAQDGPAPAQPLSHPLAFVSHINSPSDFYLQYDSDTLVLNTITDRLASAHEFDPACETFEDHMYAVEYPPEVWFRATVQNNVFHDIEVFFDDFGNTAEVDSSNIRELPEDLEDIEPIARWCCLEQVGGPWSEAAVEAFQQYSDGRTLRVEVVSGVGPRVVRLWDGETSVTELLAALSETDDRVEVVVSYVNSPSDFYIQTVDDERLGTVAASLAAADALEDLPEKTEGAVCAAKSVEDDGWYRAEVLRVAENGCEVRFIDHGNVAVSNDLRKLPAEIEALPPLAKNCSLNFATNIPESVKEEFSNLTMGGSTVFRCRVVRPGKRDVISLMLNGKLLESTLLSDLLLDNVEPGPEPGQSPPIDDGTDDDKTNKIVETYMNAARNETDEEKRVKIAISVVGDGQSPSEGFKSDDEKVTPEASAVQEEEIVNVTDSELIDEEVADSEPIAAEVADSEPIAAEVADSEPIAAEVADSEPIAAEVADSEPIAAEVAESEPIAAEVADSEPIAAEVADSEPIAAEVSDSEPIAAEVADSEPIAEVVSSVTEAVDDACEAGQDDEPPEREEPGEEDHAASQRPGRNNADKIVPGSVSRGISAEELQANELDPAPKLPRDDKIVPGSISRGASLEVIANGDASPCPTPQPLSASAPGTPSLHRRVETPSYCRVSHEDRLLPGSVSRGSTPEEPFPAVKLPSGDKILPGTVNGNQEV